MEAAPAGKLIIPNVRIPKVFGILNIVFASGLILYGLCLSGYMLLLPTMGRAMNQMVKKAAEKQDADRKAQLSELDEEEKAAKTADEKAEVQARRKQIESEPKAAIPMTMDLDKMGLTDASFQTYVWADFGTGLLLNLLMMASGIALVMRRRWGLTLGLWVAGAKIVRLLAVYGYMVIAVVPGLSLKMAQFAGEMVRQQPQFAGKAGAAAPPVEVLARIYTVMYTSMGVGMILVGIIYPIISLWFLSRPAARAACTPGNAALAQDETW